MKYLIIIIIAGLTISCAEKKQKKQPDTTTKQQSMKTESILNLERNIPLFNKIFERAHYRKPDENLFDKVIWESCGVDLSKVKEPYVFYTMNSVSRLPILTDKRYVLTFEGDVDPTLADVASGKEAYMPARSCIDINNILFYDDPVAIADMLNLSENDGDLRLLTIFLKYEKNPFLNKASFRSFNDINEDDSLTISNILFYHLDTKSENRKYRRDFVRQLLNYYANNRNLFHVLSNFIFYDNKMRNWPLTENEKDYYKCLFLEEDLTVYGYEKGAVGDVRSDCNFDPSFSQRIAKQNYFGLPLLIALSRNTGLVYTEENKSERGPSAPDFGNFPTDIPSNALHGNINDPDGYVNVRSEKDNTSDILDKLVIGEEFLYWEDKENDWWKVMSKNIKWGYVHKSRIKRAE